MRTEADEQVPSVAVVIPCYNAEKWIGRAIESVFRQEYPGLELIVVDDGSTDRSLEIVKSFHKKLQWVTGPNRGGCAARNIGLVKSSAEFVLFLDADDYLEGQLLQDLASTAERLQLDLVFGVSVVETNGVRSEVMSHPVDSSREDIIKAWLTGHCVQTGAQMWASSFLKSIGGWNTHAKRRQDNELVIRSILSGARVKATSHGAVIWCDHSGPRVSRNCSEEAIRSEYEFYRRLLGQFPELKSKWAGELANHFYGLSSEAYMYGFDITGANSLLQARELGLKGHLGSTRHKLFCSVLGLSIKQKLARLRLYFMEHFAAKGS